MDEGRKERKDVSSQKFPVVQRALLRIVLIGYQTIAFILSFFRIVVSKSNQIDSLKNAQDDPTF